MAERVPKHCPTKKKEKRSAWPRECQDTVSNEASNEEERMESGRRLSPKKKEPSGGTESSETGADGRTEGLDRRLSETRQQGRGT